MGGLELVGAAAQLPLTLCFLHAAAQLPAAADRLNLTCKALQVRAHGRRVGTPLRATPPHLGREGVGSELLPPERVQPSPALGPSAAAAPTTGSRALCCWARRVAMTLLGNAGAPIACGGAVGNPAPAGWPRRDGRQDSAAPAVRTPVCDGAVDAQ